MMFFEKAKMIWIEHAGSDEYAEFLEEIEYGGGQCELKASVDGDFAVYVNGELAGFGQYPDFPWYKSVERIELSEKLRAGKNEVRILAWYCGLETTSTYYPADAGIIYEISCGGKVLAASSCKSRSRLAAGYRSYGRKIITGQLGLSFSFDAREAGAEYGASIEVNKRVNFVERPIKRLVLGKFAGARLIRAEENRYLFDLGRETVGFVDFELTAPLGCKLTFSWGEHVTDGWVRRKIGTRDFSFEYTAKEGRNAFFAPLRRLGCRYIEVEADGELSVEKIGLVPVDYPVDIIPFDAGGRQAIYDTAIHTLRCSMHDHYEDCPWREQALYAMDSRNQMLCGYYCFGEYDFAHASLMLMAKGARSDGYLAICAPATGRLAIPSFSLIYPTQVLEYELHSGRRCAEEVFLAVKRIIENFRGAVDESGLIPAFRDTFWNFYEWTDGADNGGELRNGYREGKAYDVLLQLMYLYAERSYSQLLGLRGESYDYDVEPVKRAVRREFLLGDGTYALSSDIRRSSELACALAILTGVATDGEKLALCDMIKRGELTEASLSMRAFVWDALMSCGEENARAVLQDIDEKYGFMLERGATTFWETMDGEAAFSNAGSLCHGWSAMPVYYFHKLL